MSISREKAMADIFISYARDDRSKAQRLAEAFEGRGWSVWWDTRLQAGEVWDEVIERELGTTRCVVVLWSKTSVQKHWVRVEAHEGLQRRILVSALIEDVQLPLAFRLVQAEPLLGWSGEPSHAGLNRLLAAISERLRTQVRLGARLLSDLAVFHNIEVPWCPEMVALPTGTFWMGSPEDEEERFSHEGPRHRVTIGYRFAIGRYPVTFAEYDHFCAATKREKPGDSGWGRGWRPVINVTWQDATVYCDWLARETGKPYRLPSEAEWEYACRAGTTTRYWCGDMITKQDAKYGGWFGKTTEVGSYSPNPWGLYDTHGNVWEWMEDVWHDSYEGAPADGAAWTDGEGKQSSRSRVLRGGSWFNYPRSCRSAGRLWNQPDYRIISIGFRVARTLD